MVFEYDPTEFWIDIGHRNQIVRFRLKREEKILLKFRYQFVIVFIIFKMRACFHLVYYTVWHEPTEFWKDRVHRGRIVGFEKFCVIILILFWYRNFLNPIFRDSQSIFIFDNLFPMFGRAYLMIYKPWLLWNLGWEGDFYQKFYIILISEF